MACNSVSAFAQLGAVTAVQWDLKHTTGTLETLDANRVAIRRADGSKVVLRPDELAFLEFIDQRQAIDQRSESRTGQLLLVDGTRYTGWAEVERGVVVWRNWWAGTVRPTIEQTLWFIDENTAIPPKASTEDVLILQNGDRIDGLVESLGDVVQVERADTSVINVPFERIAAMAFLNDPAEPTGTRLWLRTGDEVLIEDFAFEQGTGFRMPRHERLRVNMLAGIAFEPAQQVALAGLDSHVEALTTSPRFHVPNPSQFLQPSEAWPLDAPTVVLSGPMRATWTLPERGMGFVARAVLPAGARELGDLELVVFDNDVERARIALHARHATETLAIRIESDHLAIELHEAGGGPVQDTVHLERALLLGNRKRATAR